MNLDGYVLLVYQLQNIKVSFVTQIPWASLLKATRSTITEGMLTRAQKAKAVRAGNSTKKKKSALLKKRASPS